MKPLPVLGYTEQKDTTVDVVYENKVLEELVLRRIDRIKEETDPNDLVRMNALEIAHEKAIEAFMWLNRSIFAPKRITDDDDMEIYLPDLISSLYKLT